MEPSTQEPVVSAHTERRLIIPALFVVLIVVALYYWFSPAIGTAPVVPASQQIATQPKASIPKGFPGAIPVEAANLTEANVIGFDAPKATQYVVSYSSRQSLETLWQEYSDYLTSAGYTVNTKGTNKTQGVVDAIKKGQAELNILITPKKSGSEVHITYVSVG